MIDIVDSEWLSDELPCDQIAVPSENLPDPEADNGDCQLTLKEQVNKCINYLRSQAYNFSATERKFAFYICRRKSGVT